MSTFSSHHQGRFAQLAPRPSAADRARTIKDDCNVGNSPHRINELGLGLLAAEQNLDLQ